MVEKISENTEDNVTRKREMIDIGDDMASHTELTR
jgi:hypothetical protein